MKMQLFFAFFATLRTGHLVFGHSRVAHILGSEVDAGSQAVLLGK